MEQTMYDTTKLSDAIDAVQDIRTALDYLVAAQEILKRHEVINLRMHNELHYITTLVRNDVMDRADQFEYLD
jgi:hypothetical protein